MAEYVEQPIKDVDTATFLMLVPEAKFIGPRVEGDTVWFNFAVEPEKYAKLMQDYYNDTGRALVPARQYSLALKSVRDIIGVCRHRGIKVREP